VDEREAVSLLKRGDISGLQALVEAHQVRAIRAAYLVTHDRSMAEDVVATAFLRVYERAYQFDSKRPFAPWFLRIVVNDSIKAASRRSRHVPLDERMMAREGTLAGGDPSPEEAAERSGVRRAVRQALDGLSPSQRAAIVMRYYLGMRESEIADRLGRTPGTVKRHLHDGRVRLRGMLAGLWGRPLPEPGAESRELPGSSEGAEEGSRG
jgi:RNA polymerase sigma-70 factor (ECF subfamily)